MNLGRQGEAAAFYNRSIAMDLDKEDWKNASRGYQNLVDLYAHLGTLSAAADAAYQALNLARHAHNKVEERDSLAYQAWIAHLLGDLKTSSATFQQAEALEREINPKVHYLHGHRGIQYADHLRRIGEVNYARQIMEANLEIWIPNSKSLIDESRCNRVLGDLDADSGHSKSAQHRYDEALKIARRSSRWVLIEALLAQGRWAARNREVEVAHGYLDEALNYAVTGSYRIYEIDICVALGWAYYAAGDTSSVRAQGERAQHLSADIGYHWGRVDAAEMLTALNEMIS
jgi:tetratricopeptide (TPR) repeat protein